MIGNDIVDLHYFGAPFYQHVRYLGRICAPDEAEAVRKSQDAPRTLAAVWAAKEAAYKLVSRNSNLRHFVPRDFATDIACRGSRSGYDELRVSYGGTHASVTIFGTGQWVHALAAFRQCSEVHWKVQEIHEPPFGIITPRDESDISRQLARELLYECGLKDACLDFVGRIPMLHQVGPFGSEAAISLSHHGRFVAAALAWNSGESQKQSKATGNLAVSSSSRAA